MSENIPTPWPGTQSGPVESGPSGSGAPSTTVSPSQKPSYFKDPASVANIHSDSRPRGYLPAGAGKR